MNLAAASAAFCDAVSESWHGVTPAVARWHFGREWSERKLCAWLKGLPSCPLNFRERPEEMTPERGWKFSPFERPIGREPIGPPLPDGPFHRVRVGLSRYEFSDPKIVEAHFDPEVPLQGRCMLLIFKAGGFRFLNPVRVTQVWEEADARHTCFGFEYATLAGHMERGFERFFVTKDHSTGELRLRIEDHWTYGDFPTWWSRIGFALIGWIPRKQWPRHAAMRLRKLAKGECLMTEAPVNQSIPGAEASPSGLAPEGAATQLERLRDDLLHGQSADLQRRRGIICLSLLGASAMALVALRQIGVVGPLPDLPLDGFDTERLNTSDIAYQFGVPDAALATASFAANLPIAALGGVDRTEQMPWVPIISAGKAGVDAAVSGWYFAQMPIREKAWCPYCIVSALASFGILALTLPEAQRAWKHSRHPRTGSAGSQVGGATSAETSETRAAARTPTSGAPALTDG